MERDTLHRQIIDCPGSLVALLFSIGVIFALTLTLTGIDLNFFRAFGLMVLQIAVSSAAGVVIGVSLAEVVLRSDWMTQSTISFLRFGLWLPFFAAWATSTWWTPWDKLLGVSLGVRHVLAIAIPILPTVTFAAFYYYLSARQTLGLNRRWALFVISTPTLLHSFFFSFLAQLNLYRDGWQWWGSVLHADWVAHFAATVLIGGFLGLMFFISPGYGTIAKVRVGATLRQLYASKPSSAFGAATLWLLCFAIWDFYSVFLRDFFALSPLRDVARAAYMLLTVGPPGPNLNEMPFLLDVSVSLQEIGMGLLLGGALALVLVKLIQLAESTTRISWLLVFTHSIPIVFAITLMPVIGIGTLLRAVIIGAATLFPFAEIFWGALNVPLTARILLALENALPYAFIGMLFAEAWASTAGLGFLILMCRASGSPTEGLATALITLLLMLSVSLVLRLVNKKLVKFERLSE